MEGVGRNLIEMRVGCCHREQLLVLFLLHQLLMRRPVIGVEHDVVPGVEHVRYAGRRC